MRIMRRNTLLPIVPVLFLVGPLLPRPTLAEPSYFGPYDISSIERVFRDLNYEMTHDVGSVGGKIQQFAKRIPRIILPVSLGAILEGTDEAVRFGIDKKFLLEFGSGAEDADLALVMTTDELERFVENASTGTMLDAIGGSGILFKPKNFKAKVAIDYLQHEMDLDIEVDESCRPAGIEGLFVKMASKGLGLLLRSGT
jgi:hypothetical protein